MILGYEFCDKLVEAISPRSRLVELDDDMTVAMMLGPSAQPHDAPPLPADQEYVAITERVCPNASVVNRKALPAQSQTWVQVKTKRERLVLVKPTRK